MELNEMMMPTSMYRHRVHRHHYSYPPATSYLTSPVYRDDLPPIDALGTGTAASSSRSDAAAGDGSPFYDDSPSSSGCALTGLRGPQLPSAAAAAAAAAADAAAATSWRYDGNGARGTGSTQCAISTHSNLQPSKLRLPCEYLLLQKL